MSAPLLTPLDTPIFDDDVIAEMEEHADDVPQCICWMGAPCPAIATHSASCNACTGLIGLVCATHAMAVVEDRRVAVHASCGSSGSVCDLVKVVPL